MNNLTVIVLIEIPGCGKSAFANIMFLPESGPDSTGPPDPLNFGFWFSFFFVNFYEKVKKDA